RLDLAHLVGRDEPSVDAGAALQRHRDLHRRTHALVHPEQVAGAPEPARSAACQLLEALEEVERVADHPAGLDGRVVLADAGRALPGGAGRDEALVDDDDLAHAAGGQVMGDARADDAASDDHHVRGEGHGGQPITISIIEGGLDGPTRSWPIESIWAMV